MKKQTSKRIKKCASQKSAPQGPFSITNCAFTSNVKIKPSRNSEQIAMALHAQAIANEATSRAIASLIEKSMGVEFVNLKITTDNL